MKFENLLSAAAIISVVLYAGFSIKALREGIGSVESYMNDDLQLKRSLLQVQAMQVITIACQGEEGSLVGSSVKCGEVVDSSLDVQ